MSVTVLGVMVPQTIAYGTNQEPLPAPGWLVRLTVTEETPRRGDKPTLISSTKATVWPDFERAAQNAFCWWKQNRGDVVWTLVACDGRKLPDLKGPSLGGAFAVGLTLLHYRGDPGATDKLDKEFAAAVAYADFSEVVVSAEALTLPEAIPLGAVGGLDWKTMALAGRPLVFSKEQPEFDTEEGRQILIPAASVREAINQVFDLQAMTILQKS
jgi:hypothetical protein